MNAIKEDYPLRSIIYTEMFACPYAGTRGGGDWHFTVFSPPADSEIPEGNRNHLRDLHFKRKALDSVSFQIQDKFKDWKPDIITEKTTVETADGPVELDPEEFAHVIFRP